jgi:hypothetical protein
MSGLNTVGARVGQDALGVQGNQIRRYIHSFDDACVPAPARCLILIRVADVCVLATRPAAASTSQTNACRTRAPRRPRTRSVASHPRCARRSPRIYSGTTRTRPRAYRRQRVRARTRVQESEERARVSRRARGRARWRSSFAARSTTTRAAVSSSASPSALRAGAGRAASRGPSSGTRRHNARVRGVVSRAAGLWYEDWLRMLQASCCM